MDEIDPALTRRIARLARLELDDGEVRRLTDDLREILRRVADLPEVEEDGEVGGGTVHADLSPRLRADVPSADPLARSPEELAPDVRDGFFVVPRLSSMDGGGEHGEGDG